MVHRHPSRGNLHQKLGQRLEGHDIIHDTENHDHDGAQQDAPGGTVDIGQDDDREEEGNENGQAA